MSICLQTIWRAACGLLPLLFALAMPQHAQAEGRNNRMLIVAVDHSVEHSRDLMLLSQQVAEAANSQLRWIYAHTLEAGAEVTIGDAERDKGLVDELEHRFAGRNKVVVTKTPARSFWIAYSPAALKQFDAEALRKRYNQLEDFILRLRTPVPGVTIEPEGDGALIRSQDHGIEEVLREKLFMLVIVEPRSATSWRVAWNKENTSERLRAWPVEKAVRFFIAEPLDLVVEPNGSGAMFTVIDPERYSGFVQAVRTALAHHEQYVLTETASLVMRIERRDISRDPAALLPDPAAFDLLSEIEELANPSVQVNVIGDTVWAHAKDPARNIDRAAIIRSALATRSDLIIASRPDQSLVVSLAPGAYLFPPKPPVDPARLANTIDADARALKLGPVQVASVGVEKAEVTFASDIDAAVFRRAVSNIGRLAFRLVEEPPSYDEATIPPSPGDERLPISHGGYVWVKPGTILSGDMIAEAKVETNTYSQQPVVAIHLTDDGRAVFAAATRLHVGERLAVVIDGVVVTAPYIREPIEGGQVEIDGAFTPDSASALVKKIVPYPSDFPLRIVEGDTAPR
jgi:hypothetical protein